MTTRNIFTSDFNCLFIFKWNISGGGLQKFYRLWTIEILQIMRRMFCVLVSCAVKLRRAASVVSARIQYFPLILNV